jgi:tetratricopeptide (TPR) repeat protein
MADRRAQLVDCRAMADRSNAVATIVADDSAVPIITGVDLDRGTAVGRYVVLGLLGAGGMGAVYAAFDPELDRKVALKLLHGSPDGTPGTGGQQAALLREAQVMAKLSHPNVVAVHDAGAFRDRVFVAMELVDGVTLSQWLVEARRSTREIVGVMRQAGRGLAAAHEAGLVHRDFKADNVMIDRQGRVRVMDFGLARPYGDASASISRCIGYEVTQAGAMAGTPAYMAPEQFRGEPADDRSDQFSFAVTLWEALYGERPFTGGSLVELATHVMDGQRATPPRDRDAPKWLRRILDRALSTERGERYPSMDALLVDLDRDPSRARVRWAAATTITAGLGAAFLWHHVDERQRVADCEATAAQVDETWNATRMEDVHASLRATGLAHAQSTFDRVTPWLDDYATHWRTAASATCDGSMRHDLAARSIQCLDERRVAFDSLVDRLSAADASAVQNAVRSAAALPPLAGCRDERWLVQRAAAPAGNDGDTVIELRRRLALSRAHDSAGRPDDALHEAQAVLEEARALGWAPLVAEAELRVGIAHERAGDLEAAERSLRAAYFDAGAAGADDVAADAATRLSSVLGHARARFDEGLEWAAQAQMMLDRIGDTASLRAAVLADSRGGIHNRRGELEAAIEAHEQSLAIRERVLGPDHPGLSVPLVNIGTAYSAMSQNDRALAYLERALAIDEASVGPDHPDLARVLVNLAVVQTTRGDLDDAAAHATRALALQERALASDHPELAPTLGNLGNVAIMRRDYASAERYLERALAIQQDAHGAEHPDVAGTLANLATVHAARGELDAAADRYTRALEVWEQALGREHPVLALALTGLGYVQLERGLHRDALPPLERALTIAERGPSQPDELASTRFSLARALWDGGGDRRRARVLAEQAREVFHAAGPSRSGEHDEVVQWLAARTDDVTARSG